MRLRIIFFCIILLTIIFFIIRITAFSRRSPQLFLMEQDVINLMQKNETKNDFHRRIPRTIHQTWKNSTIPGRWNSSVQSVRQLNDDQFKYRLWTDEDMHKFVREKEPILYEKTFLTYSYDIQRVDAFRYVILYHLGGIYIDMDAGCSKSLNILLDVLESLDPQSKHLAALPATQPNGVSNDFMISTKGHPFFGQLISHLSLFNHNYIVHYLTVMLSAGSLYVTVNEYLFNTLSQAAPVRIIEDKVYSPLFLWFARGSTWHGRDAKLVTSIYTSLSSFFQNIPLVCYIILIFVIIGMCCLHFRHRFTIRRLRRLSASFWIDHCTVGNQRNTSKLLI